MKTAVSPTVNIVHGVWQRLECVVCKAMSHGPQGMAIPRRDIDRFVAEHRICEGAFREEKTPTS